MAYLPQAKGPENSKVRKLNTNYNVDTMYIPDNWSTLAERRKHEHFKIILNNDTPNYLQEFLPRKTDLLLEMPIVLPSKIKN